MTYPTYHNLIGGQWLPAASGKTILNLNPADHTDVVGAFPDSNAEDVELAVAAASKAFANVAAGSRAQTRRYSAARGQHPDAGTKEQFAQEMTREMGKVLAETRGDVQEAIDEAFYVAGEGRRLFGVTTPSELENKFAMSVRAALGVVGLITPWNFPMAIPSWKLFPALVAGNTCVIKPAEDTPLSTYNLVQTLIEAGCRRASSTLSPASARAPAQRWSSIRMCAPSASLAQAKWGRSWPESRCDIQACVARDGRQECADCDGRRQPRPRA